jgi:hypothetical protein
MATAQKIAWSQRTTIFKNHAVNPVSQNEPAKIYDEAQGFVEWFLIAPGVASYIE